MDEDYKKEIYKKQKEVVNKFKSRPLVKYSFLFGFYGVGYCYFINNFNGLLKEFILDKCEID